MNERRKRIGKLSVNELPEPDGPFPFCRDDLEGDRLAAGVRHTLADYRRWRDGNAETIAAHVDRYTSQLESIVADGRGLAAVSRRLVQGRKRTAERARIAREVNYFGVYTMGEVLAPDIVAQAADGRHGHPYPVGGLSSTSIDKSLGVARVAGGVSGGVAGGVAGVLAALEQHLPVLGLIPERSWLAERLDTLYRILPEPVIRSGCMGKVIRATAAVLGIGVYDTLDASPVARKEHLTRILPGAYAFGAGYAIVDDTFHDLPGEHLPAAQREHYHREILRALATGAPVDDSAVPDHPLAEELHRIYESVLKSYPFADFRHLYHAAESMYLAQHNDSRQPVPAVHPGGLESAYSDIVVKSGMSRVVANILGRRSVPDSVYAGCLNAIFLSQLKDDLIDRAEDLRAGRSTPFTVPAEPAGANPLYDLFAYDAYAANQVFGGAPAATDALTYFGALKLATHLSTDPAHTGELLGRYETTDEIARFLLAATGTPRRPLRRARSVEMRLKEHGGELLRHRKPTEAEARTFVADRLGYINDVITRHCCPEPGATGLDEIVAYAMSAPGKRLRPALGLMLAEGLDVDTASIEPFVAASELFHTASLLFDDLPAQDDAAVRRGRPTAHTVFDEGSVQLAAVSMISSGFGILAGLGSHHPAEKVTEVIAYIGSVLGPTKLCRGQDLDLRFGRTDEPITGDDILEMYHLKTSTTIEAALVPLMMLTDRPPSETDLVRRYAYHAGIVFQIRDDILDLTSSIESLGKDTGNDVGKVNVVRVYGLPEARQLMRNHLADAVACCAELPFDTRLLVGMVNHFANRKR